jgi:hypothetical protein
MTRSTFTILLPFFLISLALSGPLGVRADALPPEQSACLGVDAGDACPSGTCEATKCRRANLQGWDRDASPTPPTLEYDCLLCVEHDDGGGCSLAYDRLASAFGPWLVGSLALLMLYRRRER